jgi:predicted component of type VI protein secretion system
VPPELLGRPPQRPGAHPPPPPPPARREETLIPPEDELTARPAEEQGSTAFMCPHCESPLSNPAAAQCETCLRPLRQQAPVLRLVFPSGELKVAPGQHLVLGRDAGQSPVAATFTRYDNVSRRHSTVWLDPAGAAWVRDERSTNGTFVNNQRLPPGSEAPLRDGDSLRLAADAAAAVHLH